jgi:polysaccharide export outer membrane protein
VGHVFTVAMSEAAGTPLAIMTTSPDACARAGSHGRAGDFGVGETLEWTACQLLAFEPEIGDPASNFDPSVGYRLGDVVMLHQTFCRSALISCVFVAALSVGVQAATPSVAADYRIREGDLLSVTVYDEPTWTQPQARVLPGGTIVEPLVGQVRVSGLTPTQASGAIALVLTRYVRTPKVTVAVEQLGPFDIYVLGDVKTPGKYALEPSSHLMDALAAAGGLGPIDGELPDARVAAGTDVQTVSLQRLLHGGDLSQNVALSNDMTVYVPSPITFNIQVFGAVDHPGDVTLHEGDRLVVAIARAGNSVNSNADLNHVTLQRPAPDGKVQTQSVNLYDVYKSGDLARDPVLQKGDTVYVPQGTRRDAMSPAMGIFSIMRMFLP